MAWALPRGLGLVTFASWPSASPHRLRLVAWAPLVAVGSASASWLSPRPRRLRLVAVGSASLPRGYWLCLSRLPPPPPPPPCPPLGPIRLGAINFNPSLHRLCLVAVNSACGAGQTDNCRGFVQWVEDYIEECRIYSPKSVDVVNSGEASSENEELAIVKGDLKLIRKKNRLYYVNDNIIWSHRIFPSWNYDIYVTI
ncbi:uncharacterized protein LOC130135322 [Syzygium oleosum]|uniref:uncharacterized protein LOC130135322 n=1 Tax=Syzygium oleosum TaxID=219896 RepID=UPI0024BB8707|nr:uncharacterized protein LOC130135322 [Syzygium oleosum]